ncbi:MAG TPA: hypothetical protein VHX88_22130 [Solirubrobacteraceae bacterium]|nr:hypothetical protein [Solirubrobacteraceae bacterium]
MGLVTSWLGAPAALEETGGGADPLGARRLRDHRTSLARMVSRALAPVGG